jgi:LPXTG-motif cell wall-anchored protein
MRRFLLLGLLFIAAALTVSSAPAIAQDEGDENSLQIEFLDAPTVAFPEIAIDLRVLDNGRAIPGLGTNAFSVDDNVESGSLTVNSDEQTANLAVVLDLPTAGPGEDDKVIEVARQFFEDGVNYQDGLTVVLVVVRNNNYTFNVYSDRASILARLNQIEGGVGQANPITEALDVAANQLLDASGEEAGGNLLLVSPFYYNRSASIAGATDLAQRIATENGYTVSVVQAWVSSSASRSNQNDDYLEIAEAGQGAFAAYGPNADESILQPVYETMRGGQATYTLRYRTSSAAPGDRTVTVSAETPNGTASGQFSYSGPDAAPPTVSFFDPAEPTTVERQSPVRGAAFDLNEVELSLSIADVADGNSITEGRVEVVVDGEVQSTLPIPPASLNPGVVAVTWPLLNFGLGQDSDSITRQVELRAVLTDAFDREVTATQTVTVITRLASAATSTPVPPTPTVAPPTATPTQLPTTEPTAVGEIDGVTDATLEAAIAIATQTAEAIIALQSGDAEDAQATAEAIRATAEAVPPEVPEVEEDTGSEDDTNTLIAAGAAAVGVLVLAILSFLLVRRRRQRRQGSMQTMLGGGQVNPNASSMKTMVGGSGGGTAAAAQLEILSGTMSGQTVKVDRDHFTIGREAGADIHFATPAYDNVSSRHCSILKRGAMYMIEDHGSTNGTHVNGQRISSNMPTNLPPQAMIQLGNDPVSSIRMRFKPPGAGGAGIGKTRVDMPGMQGMPVDNAVWNKKTQMYGQQSSNTPPQQQQGTPQQAAPGQFFNPSAQPPQPQQRPQQQQQPPPNYRQKGNFDSWTNVPDDDDDSWLEDE